MRPKITNIFYCGIDSQKCKEPSFSEAHQNQQFSYQQMAVATSVCPRKYFSWKILRSSMVSSILHLYLTCTRSCWREAKELFCSATISSGSHFYYRTPSLDGATGKSFLFSSQNKTIVCLWSMFENRQFSVVEGKCRRFRNSSECLKTHCAANNWPIWRQKVPKEA